MDLVMINRKRVCSECKLELACSQFSYAEWKLPDHVRWCRYCKKTSSLPVEEARFIAQYLNNYQEVKNADKDNHSDYSSDEEDVDFEDEH
jgi:hypothetical protein